ncbi:MAG: class I SAM-dependent methyltransferase [Crocinitomicaceae bacterium]|nr:class I SAM-dependent methyltransferase [Crocinitomicaceae bacterium]
MSSDYQNLNKESWNERTKAHVKSAFYDNDNFIKGKNSLNSIELEMLGDLEGKSVLHLQCHFGQDTISLTRLGATATGVDLSDEAINTAQELAQKTNSDATFVCCDIYDLPNHLEGQFDIVFTSYGTIGWLPDMDRWASVVNHFLKPKGQFLIVEFHPFVWTFDNDFAKIGHNYFNTQAYQETETGTYADKDAPIELEYVMWNHPISEVMNALIAQGLTIQAFNEYNYSPYDCFSHTEEFEPGKFRIKHFGDKFPMVYALKMLGQ